MLDDEAAGLSLNAESAGDLLGVPDAQASATPLGTVAYVSATSEAAALCTMGAIAAAASVSGACSGDYPGQYAVSWAQSALSALSGSSAAGAGTLEIAPSFSVPASASPLSPLSGTPEAVSFSASGSPTPSVAVQWYDCNSQVLTDPSTATGVCSKISGALAQSTPYTPTSAGAGGQYLSVVASASNGVGSAAQSYSAPVLIDAAPGGGSVSISPASPIVNIQESASATGFTGTPTPSVTYTWYDCAGASGYNPTAGQCGSSLGVGASYTPNTGGGYLSVVATASNGVGSNAQVYSTPVLVSSSGTAASDPATTVLGQLGSFTTGPATDNTGGLSASSLAQPRDLAVDHAGDLYVADTWNNRVLYFPAGQSTATRVYGQSGSFTTDIQNDNAGAINAGGLAFPEEVAIDPSSGGLYVSDHSNNRVLYYPPGQTTPTRVYGQDGSFSTGCPNQPDASTCAGTVPAPAADSLDGPTGLAVDSSGGLYVDDYANSRVLYYPAGQTTATRVYGQAGSFTTNAVNDGGLSATSIDGPIGVALDAAGDLYIADTTNNRILYYPAGQTTATRVYGQAGSFSTACPDQPGASSCAGTTPAPSASSLWFPTGLALDGAGDLYVADFENSRVLFYPSGQTTATHVYGQSGSFTTGAINEGGVSADSFYLPEGVSVDGAGNLYVADYDNSRVLIFP